MTRFILVRHGETEWNRVERYRGRADVPLNEVGLAQAKAVARRIAETWPVSAVYSSPLARAMKTAEAIAGCFSLSVVARPALIDIHYGHWQGLTPAEVRERWPHSDYVWRHIPQLARIPGGETLDEIRQRTMPELVELAARHPEENVVLVSHTVVNRVILLSVLGLSTAHFWRLRQDTAALNVFEWEGGIYTLVTLNDTCHLRASGR